MKPRILTPREQNFLRRHRIDANDVGKREMPIEYFVGWAEFAGREFVVNRHTLIPRIETEELVAAALSDLQELSSRHHTPLRVADVGTGCGCIGITLWLETQKLEIPIRLSMIDISDEALEVARENIQRVISLGKIKVKSDIKIIKSHLLDQIGSGIKFDLIIANLPYIPSTRIESLPKSVTDFEPRLALDGGKDGLELIKRLLFNARGRIKPHGRIALEIDDTHSPVDFKEFLDWPIEIRKDSFGKNRFLMANAPPSSPSRQKCCGIKV